jgi:hypothetical protein
MKRGLRRERNVLRTDRTADPRRRAADYVIPFVLEAAA